MLESTGEPVMFQVLDWLQVEVDNILRNPPPLTSLKPVQPESGKWLISTFIVLNDYLEQEYDIDVSSTSSSAVSKKSRRGNQKSAGITSGLLIRLTYVM